MNKLHTLLLAFSTMTSATAWAEAPALQSPALATSSEAKESPFKKLMALLAKAKQQQAQGQAQGPVAPAPAVSSGQELVSLIKSQGLSFKDALEKMGVGVNKRFSKRLNGKRGQKLFLNRIKKEGLSWQDAAASLKPAAAAEAAPLASATCPGDPFADFEAYLNSTYGCMGKTMSNFLESWKNLLDNPLSNSFSNYSQYQEALASELHGVIEKANKDQYKSILSCSQLEDLLDFEKAFIFQKTDALARTCLPAANLYNSIKNSTDPLAKGLCAALKNDFYKAYRIVEKSLSIDSFDNADKLTGPITAGQYTGLSATGECQASALKALQEALDYTMDRQGLGRLIYGNKTIAALATLANQADVKADPDFLFACTNIGIGGTPQHNPCLVTKYGSLIDGILTKVPAISTQYFNGMTFSGSTNTSVNQKAPQTLSAVSNLTTYLKAAGYTVTDPGKNQSLTLQLWAAANNDPISNCYLLTEAEKPGAYFMRQLLNGGSPSDAWLARDNTVIKSPAGQDEDAENRRNPREQSQENPSEERNIRPNNRNNVSWE